MAYDAASDGQGHSYGGSSPSLLRSRRGSNAVTINANTRDSRPPALDGKRILSNRPLEEMATPSA
jgi:hypothetical protein